MIEAPMSPLKASELLAQSIEILRKHLDWSYADIGSKLGKSRQWAYKLGTGRQEGTTITSLEGLSREFSVAAGCPIEVSDLFHPDRIKALLGGKQGVTKSFTPPSNAGIAHADRLALSELQSQRAALQSALFDIYTALHRYIGGSAGNVRSAPPPVAKAPRSGHKPR